jgi:hypothetical protein
VNYPLKAQVVLCAENVIDNFLSLTLGDDFSDADQLFQVAVAELQKQIAQTFIRLRCVAVKLHHVTRIRFLEQFQFAFVIM